MKMIDERKQTIRLLKNSIKAHTEKLKDVTISLEQKKEHIKTKVELKHQLDHVRRNKYSSTHYEFIPNTKPNRKQRRSWK